MLPWALAKRFAGKLAQQFRSRFAEVCQHPLIFLMHRPQGAQFLAQICACRCHTPDVCVLGEGKEPPTDGLMLASTKDFVRSRDEIMPSLMCAKIFPQCQCINFRFAPLAQSSQLRQLRTTMPCNQGIIIAGLLDQLALDLVSQLIHDLQCCSSVLVVGAL